MNDEERHIGQDHFNAIPWPELANPPSCGDVPLPGNDGALMLCVWFSYNGAPLRLSVMRQLIERAQLPLRKVFADRTYATVLLGFQVIREGEQMIPEEGTPPITVMIPSFRKRFVHNLRYGATHPAISRKKFASMYNSIPGMVADTICRVFFRPESMNDVLAAIDSTDGNILLTSGIGENAVLDVRWHTLDPNDFELD